MDLAIIHAFGVKARLCKALYYGATDCLHGPFSVSSLAWLVNSLSADGVTLEEGAIVTTGAAAIIGEITEN